MVVNSNFYKNNGEKSSPYPKNKILKEMAEEAYLAYCIQLEHKDENGSPLKSWKFLSGEAKGAWINASLIVLRHYMVQKVY